MHIRLLILLFMIFFSGSSCSALTEDALQKREKIRYAVKEQLLSIYDIPFSAYVSLEMWDEIDFILENTHQNMVKYRLPEIYYSRPFAVDGQIWVFENRERGTGEIHVFDADSLKLLRTLKNDDFSRYEGGIRMVSGSRIISGGSDLDVDTAVIWDIRSSKITSLKLKEGHYVGSAAADGDILYIGSCGGLINAWQMPDLSFAGIYASSTQPNTDWEIFNSKPCITAIAPHNDSLIAAGENHIFVWNTKNRALVKTWEKILPNSLVFFYKDIVIEYKDNRIAVKNLTDGRILHNIRTTVPVDDLIVTSEELLPDQTGPVMIIALRHNRGIHFYDFNSMNLLKETDFKGESLAVFRNQIFAGDDHHIYKYNIRHKISPACEKFLKNIRPEELELTAPVYRELLRRSLLYPDVIDTGSLSRRFLELHRLELRHTVRYGKIGEKQDEETAENTSGRAGQKDIFGYKLIYEIQNRSENGVFLHMMFQWGGEYGSRENTDTPETSLQDVFFIPPGNGKVTGIITMGEKEPATLLLYPLKIETADHAYHEGLEKAISQDSRDVSLIDTYLKDPRVKRWHPALELRKKEISASGKK
ncbi:MAG: WD40 repeat domain-containing protein [Desulfococcaceae bacterium]